MVTQRNRSRLKDRPPRPPLRRRLVITLAVALLVLVMGTGTASAHYVYVKTWVMETSHGCIAGRSEISHGSGGGYAKVDTNSIVDGGGTVNGVVLHYLCFTNLYRAPGWISNAYTLWKWNGAHWYPCRRQGWVYNSSGTVKFVIAKNWGTTPPCGNGLYGTQGFSYVYNVDGDNFIGWHGGDLFAHSHQLPA